MLLSFYTDERNPDHQSRSGNVIINHAPPNTPPPGYSESQDCGTKNLLRYAGDCVCFNCLFLNLVNMYNLQIFPLVSLSSHYLEL